MTQILSKNEERHWTDRYLTDQQIVPRKRHVIEMADEIRKHLVKSITDASIELVSYPPIGTQIDFPLYSMPSSSNVLARQIDESRLQEAMPETIRRWPETVRDPLVGSDIRWRMGIIWLKPGLPLVQYKQGVY